MYQRKMQMIRLFAAESLRHEAMIATPDPEMHSRKSDPSMLSVNMFRCFSQKITILSKFKRFVLKITRSSRRNYSFALRSGSDAANESEIWKWLDVEFHRTTLQSEATSIRSRLRLEPRGKVEKTTQSIVQCCDSEQTRSSG